MKKLLFFLLICVVFLNKGQTQENIEAPVEDTLTVVQHLDQLTLLWDVESIELKTYQGLRKFCRSTAYRNSITEMLESMHHYD